MDICKSPSFGSGSPMMQAVEPQPAAKDTATTGQKSSANTKGASGLLRRLEVSRKKESLLAAALVQCFEEGVLPSQWNRHQDKEGRSYFWNSVTQMSTWTHPAEDALGELVKAGRAVLRAANPAQEASTRSEAWRHAAEESVSHWRWTSAPDGRTYYYHAETQETSWEDPRQDITVVYELKYRALEGLVASAAQLSQQHEKRSTQNSSRSTQETSSCPRMGLATKEWMDPVAYGRQLGLSANSAALKLLTPALLMDLAEGYAAWQDPKGRMYFQKPATSTEDAATSWEHPLHNLFIEIATTLLGAETSDEAPGVAVRRGLRNLREAVARRDGLGAAGPEGASGRVLRTVWAQAFPDEAFLAEDPGQEMTKAENCEMEARKAEEACSRLEEEIEKQRLLCQEAAESARDAKEKHALASARRKEEVEARIAAEAQLQQAKAELEEQRNRCSAAEEGRAQASARRSEESVARKELESEVKTLKKEVEDHQKRVADANLACAQANAQIKEAQEACSQADAEKDKQANACKHLEGELLRVISEVEEQRIRADEAEQGRDLAIARGKEDVEEKIAEKKEEASKREALQSEFDRVAQEEAQQRNRADDAEEQRALASARRKEEARACEEHRIKLKHMQEELEKATAAVEAAASSRKAPSEEETAASQARTIMSGIICRWWTQKAQVLEKEYNSYFWLHEEIEKEYKIALHQKETDVAEQKKLYDAAEAVREAAESNKLQLAEEIRQQEKKLLDFQNNVEQTEEAHDLAVARWHEEKAERTKAETEMKRLSEEAMMSAEKVHAVENATRAAQEELLVVKKRFEEEEQAHQLASARRREQEERRVEVEAQLKSIEEAKQSSKENDAARADEEQVLLMKQRLEDESQAHQLSSARRQEQERRCIEYEAELKKLKAELEASRNEQKQLQSKTLVAEEDVYEADWHESDAPPESESDHTLDAESFIRIGQKPCECSDDSRQGRSRTRPPRIAVSDAQNKNPKRMSGWESQTASTREPSPGGMSSTATERSRVGSPDTALQDEIKDLMRSREEDRRMILELKEEVRRSLGSTRCQSRISTPELSSRRTDHSPESVPSHESVVTDLLQEVLMEEAEGVVAKSLATFLPSSQRPSKRPESARQSARRPHFADGVPEAPDPPKFPPPPVPTTLPVPARKHTSNTPLKAKPEQEVGSACCRSASSGTVTRTPGRSSDALTPGSSRRRSDSSGCVHKTSRRTPRVPRWNSSTKCQGFPDMEDPSEMPTLREAWESPAAIGGGSTPGCGGNPFGGAAIGGSIPGCGGNPLGGSARKPALASDLDYRKALSYERVAHRVEKQMHQRKPRGRPYSAEMLKAYPEAARVLQAVV